MIFLRISYHHIILGTLLFLFMAKGVLLVVLFPFFQQPDEQIHYATVQHWAEPEEKDWEIVPSSEEQSVDFFDTLTYRLTEETLKIAEKTQFDGVRFQRENIPFFSESGIGPNENEILSNNWKRFVEFESSNVSGTQSIYYWISGRVERLLSGEDPIIRFFFGRTISIAIGSLVVLLAYLIARKASLSAFSSLGVATLVAFQPMFASTAAQINIDIALIFSFSLYTLAAVSLLKYGFRWSLFALLLFSTVLGLASKGPGIVLVIVAFPLCIYLAHQKLRIGWRRFSLAVLIASLVLALLVYTVIPASYFVSITHSNSLSIFPSASDSLLQYFSKAHTARYFFDTHASYWGNFGWLDTRMHAGVLSSIAALEIVALFGLSWYLFGTTARPWLLQKKYLWFFIILILALQIAIRFFDWRFFDATGKIIFSPMGRYYLPNVIPHLLLVVSGLGFFTRSRQQFERLVLWLSGGMILLSLYSIFFVIIPRYYL